MPTKKNETSKGANNETEKSETISELAHRHLMDKNHTTSDEELRNAKVEFSEELQIPDDKLFQVDNTTVTKTLSEDRDKTENDNDPPNPYSIVNS